MKISIVLPSYNEQENIKKGVLHSVYAFLEQQEWSYELILSDDGSTDGTIKALRDFAKGKNHITLIENPHRGKGPTVRAGMLAATGDYRLFTDFDQATPLSEIEKLLPFMKKGFHIAIGSREVYGSRREKEPIYRHIMGKGFNILVQMIAIPGIWDTQCGFKLFSAEATIELFPRLRVYAGNSELKAAFTGAFDVELLYLAKKHGMKIAEVPVSWKHVKTNRVDPVKDSVQMFIDIVRIRAADLAGKYR